MRDAKRRCASHINAASNAKPGRNNGRESQASDLYQIGLKESPDSIPINTEGKKRALRPLGCFNLHLFREHEVRYCETGMLGLFEEGPFESGDDRIALCPPYKLRIPAPEIMLA